MKDYLKPSLRENQDHFVFHVGTNDLDCDRLPDLITKSIVDAASSLTTGKPDVTIPNIITWNDRFMAKANEVSKCLTKLCFERNFLLIDHSKTLKSHHLNGSKLYLNSKGTPILQNNSTKVLSTIFSWQKDKNSVASTPLLNEEYIPKAEDHVDKININAELRSLRVKNLNKLIIGHLNINSLRNKFELLTHQIKDNIDILMISEAKFDASFRTSQFFKNGFSNTHRLDRNCNGGGIVLYIRNDIPSKLLSIE